MALSLGCCLLAALPAAAADGAATERLQFEQVGETLDHSLRPFSISIGPGPSDRDIIFVTHEIYQRVLTLVNRDGGNQGADFRVTQFGAGNPTAKTNISNETLKSTLHEIDKIYEINGETTPDWIKSLEGRAR